MSLRGFRLYNSAAGPLRWPMFDVLNPAKLKTGLTPTVTIRKEGGAFAAPAGAVSEQPAGSGWYELAGNATDRNTLGTLELNAVATGACDAAEQWEIVPWNPRGESWATAAALAGFVWTSFVGLVLKNTATSPIPFTLRNASSGAPAAGWTPRVDTLECTDAGPLYSQPSLSITVASMGTFGVDGEVIANDGSDIYGITAAAFQAALVAQYPGWVGSVSGGPLAYGGAPLVIDHGEEDANAVDWVVTPTDITVSYAQTQNAAPGLKSTDFAAWYSIDDGDPTAWSPAFTCTDNAKGAWVIDAIPAAATNGVSGLVRIDATGCVPVELRYRTTQLGLDTGIVLAKDHTAAALATSADMATVLGRLTSTRAGYLDKLNISGNVASSTEATAIQNNTRAVRVVPPQLPRPASGASAIVYRVELLLYDAVGNMETPDAAPTIDVVNAAGTSRNSNLDATSMSMVSTGRYRSTYTVADTHPTEELIYTFTVVEGGASRAYGNAAVVVDAVATDFTAADRAKLDAMHAALPVDTIAGAGDVQLLASSLTQTMAINQGDVMEAIGDVPTVAEFNARTRPAAEYATADALDDVPTVAELEARTLPSDQYATADATPTIDPQDVRDAMALGLSNGVTPAAGSIDSKVNAIGLKAAMIGTATVPTPSAIVASDALRIVRGDDYTTATGRALTWTDPGNWPASIASAALTIRDARTSVLLASTTCTVSAGPPVSITAELPHAKTDELPPGHRVARCDVQVTLTTGERCTIVIADVTVVADQTR